MKAPRRKRLSVVWLPTSYCNASCVYCFSDAQGESMELGAVETIAKRLADHVEEQEIDEISLFWQGGEILLLGKHWVREAHRVLQGRLEVTGTVVRHRLQSNLLLVDSEWVDIFHELFDGRVSTSFDYPNLYRALVPGEPEAFTELWLKNYGLVREANLRCGIICVPSAATVQAGAARVCRFFFDEVASAGFQVDLPFPSRSWGHAGDLTMEMASADGLAAFLAELYDEWRVNYASVGKRVQPLARLEGYFAGDSRRLPCVWGKDCASNFMCIGPRGEVGLCDCWVLSYPEFNYGNLLESPLAAILEAPARQRFRARLGELVAGECGECAYLDACFGGCPIRTYTAARTVLQADPYCDVYRCLFKHIGTEMRRTV